MRSTHSICAYREIIMTMNADYYTGNMVQRPANGGNGGQFEKGKCYG